MQLIGVLWVWQSISWRGQTYTRYSNRLYNNSKNIVKRKKTKYLICTWFVPVFIQVQVQGTSCSRDAGTGTSTGTSKSVPRYRYKYLTPTLLLTHICVTWPQWDNRYASAKIYQVLGLLIILISSGILITTDCSVTTHGPWYCITVHVLSHKWHVEHWLRSILLNPYHLTITGVMWLTIC